VSESVCDDESILRNEAPAEPDDLGGWGRLPQGDAPGAEAAAPGARWTSQLDPSHPALVPDQGVDRQPSPQHETTAAPATAPGARWTSQLDPSHPALVTGRGAEVQPFAPEENSGAKDVNEASNPNDRNPRGDEPKTPRAAALPPEVAHLAHLLVPMDRDALDRLTDTELKARRWAMYRLKRRNETGR
jgi:hypothetical protein